jgi:UDP-N-acetylglucosamine--N-acetylmuramyl-(pentapeptide) pyrophosphoryl-undecaprenol N-acetylglucosamine transferase
MNIKPKKRVHILMTGGHITPAIATIEELRARFPDWHIVFVGRRKAIEGQRSVAEEQRLIEGMGLRFVPLVTGRLKREGGIGTLFSLLKFPVGLVQSAMIVARERPTIIVSFGGYVALPVVCVAWVFRIPVVTHEQTTRPGLANRIISRFASRVCVSFPESSHELGVAGKVEITGLPMRHGVLVAPKNNPFSVVPSLPLLLFLGGSTGSVSINEKVFAALPHLLSRFTIIHQVGRISEQLAQKAKASLPSNLQKHYLPYPYLSTEEYSYALHHASLIIGRSGANTVTEIAIVGKVAVCIPLPWAANNEQYHNAKFLEHGGSAIILVQKDLTPRTLEDAIDRMMSELPERTSKAKALAKRIPKDGAKRFVDVISQVLLPHTP